MNKLLFYSNIFILFFGCTSHNNQNFKLNDNSSQYIKEYNKTEIDSIIQHNDYTIIFGWTEWCRASQSELKEHLVPYMKKAPANIGIISICCGNYEKIKDFLRINKCEHSIYLLSDSWGGLDKWRLNKRFHKLFDKYKSVNYVPIVILCDTQKQILNWNTNDKRYNGIAYSISQIKQ